MTKGFQNRGATKSGLLLGIIIPTALTRKGNVSKLTKAEATAVLKESDSRSAACDHIALLLYDGV